MSFDESTYASFLQIAAWRSYQYSITGTATDQVLKEFDEVPNTFFGFVEFKLYGNCLGGVNSNNELNVLWNDGTADRNVDLFHDRISNSGVAHTSWINHLILPIKTVTPAIRYTMGANPTMSISLLWRYINDIRGQTRT